MTGRREYRPFTDTPGHLTAEQRRRLAMSLSPEATIRRPGTSTRTLRDAHTIADRLRAQGKK